MTGMLVKMYCPVFGNMQWFIGVFLHAGALRCLSPNRTKPCDEPASKIFWQDRAEWYPCCHAHWPGGDQWCGNTGYAPHEVELVVIPEKAKNALKDLDDDDRSRIKVEMYDREEELRNHHG